MLITYKTRFAKTKCKGIHHKIIQNNHVIKKWNTQTNQGTQKQANCFNKRLSRAKYHLHGGYVWLNTPWQQLLESVLASSLELRVISKTIKKYRIPRYMFSLRVTSHWNLRLHLRRLRRGKPHLPKSYQLRPPITWKFVWTFVWSSLKKSKCKLLNTNSAKGSAEVWLKFWSENTLGLILKQLASF